jgi:1-acyl-sn-glycerol-3-phosphate acyltransferase
MKYFRPGLRLIFTLYSGILFVLSFFIMIPFYVIVFNFWKKETAPHVAHKLTRIWAYLLFIIFIVKPKIKNKHFIDRNETYVFISNHRSQMDIPICAAACKNTFRFLAKAELIKAPLLGYMIKNLYITVSRSNKADRSRSMDAMKKSMDEHISVSLYPEGTRNKTKNPLIDFHDGAFRLAIKTQKPLAVLTIKDSDKVLPPVGAPLIFPGIVHAEWSKPIDTKGMTEDDLPALKENAKNLMLKILNEKPF